FLQKLGQMCIFFIYLHLLFEDFIRFVSIKRFLFMPKEKILSPHNGWAGQNLIKKEKVFAFSFLNKEEKR
ncbi:hypothetical protein, partial [Helicobacter cappadocius]